MPALIRSIDYDKHTVDLKLKTVPTINAKNLSMNDVYLLGDGIVSLGSKDDLLYTNKNIKFNQVFYYEYVAGNIYKREGEVTFLNRVKMVASIKCTNGKEVHGIPFDGIWMLTDTEEIKNAIHNLPQILKKYSSSINKRAERAHKKVHSSGGSELDLEESKNLLTSILGPIVPVTEGVLKFLSTLNN